MGNGLFAVDGINIAELVAEHVGPRMLDATLYKPTGPGTRSTSNPTEVEAPDDDEPVAHACKGFIKDFDPRVIDGNLIKTGDRKITLIAGTIEGGVSPEGGDSVSIEGTRYHVHKVLARDAAAATFVLQTRDL